MSREPPICPVGKSRNQRSLSACKGTWHERRRRLQDWSMLIFKTSGPQEVVIRDTDFAISLYDRSREVHQFLAYTHVLLVVTKHLCQEDIKPHTLQSKTRSIQNNKTALISGSPTFCGIEVTRSCKSISSRDGQHSVIGVSLGLSLFSNHME